MTTSSSFISLMNLNLRVSSWRRAVAQNHEKVFKSNTRPKNQYYLKVDIRADGISGAKGARGAIGTLLPLSNYEYQMMQYAINLFLMIGQQA